MKPDPCRDCNTSYVGCKHACRRVALLDNKHPDHELAVWLEKENKHHPSTVGDVVDYVNDIFRKTLGTHYWTCVERTKRKRKEEKNDKKKESMH